MTEEITNLALFAAALLVGFAVGMLYFAALWQSTKRFLVGPAGAGTAWILLGFLLRLGIVLLALFLSLKAGASVLQLLIATGGFTLARMCWTRRKARQE